MKREIIRVEPLSTYLERWKAPTSAVTRHGGLIFVSGFPPFDPATGEVIDASIERQTELVLEQMKLCVETAGSSLENVLKCNVYCTSVDQFAAVNAIYAKYFQKTPRPEFSSTCRPGRDTLTLKSNASLQCYESARPTPWEDPVGRGLDADWPQRTCADFSGADCRRA